jgi:hypothetical protein
MRQPWSVTSNYTTLTLRYDLYCESVQTTVAKAGETLKVSHKDELRNPFVLIDGWDDLAFFVRPTLIAFVE